MDPKHLTLPLTALEPDPDNPRSDISPSGLDQLVDNLRQLSQLVEIIVYPHTQKPGVYVVADGHRRLKAMPLAGISQARCAVLEAKPDPLDLLVMQVALGNTAERLNVLDTADVAQKLVIAHPHLPQKQIAARLGTSAPTLSKCLGVGEHLAISLRGRVTDGTLPPSVAFSLARLRDDHPGQIELADLYAAGRLTRDSVEERVKRRLGRRPARPKLAKARSPKGVVVWFPLLPCEELAAEFALFVEAVRRCIRLNLPPDSLPTLLKP